MICRTCLRRAATALPQRSLVVPTGRQFSTTLLARNAASPAGDASVASKPAADGTVTIPASSGASLSSCPAGTVLAGLNYLKNKTDPVALPDEEYPAWLWKCLEVKNSDANDLDDNAADIFSKSRKERRIALKKQRLAEARMLETGDFSALEPKIPLHQQSINLPAAEDGSVESALRAVDARHDLRKSMSKERKAKIKEANYLKTM